MLKYTLGSPQARELVTFKAMKNGLRNAIAGSLFLQIALVQWARHYPDWVETWYSKGLYPDISGFFRYLYGWIPFSFGDVLYTLLTVGCLWYLIHKRHKIRKKPLEFFRNVILVLAVAYFTFHMMWGLNYYRKPLNKTMGLEDSYSQTELIGLTESLIRQTNRLQLQITGDSASAVVIPYSQKEIRNITLEGYSEISGLFPFLQYRKPSLKNSLFSTALTYMGYGGYLNPFTNEAQVNRRIPPFRYPVICGHEIGHQLGYSAENETNFIGYLVTASNKDPYFQYAAYAYASSYCLAEIRTRDAGFATNLYSGFNAGVQKNFNELETFWERFENPMEPVFKNVFHSFLKANNQAEGIKSYNRIVTLLVAYHKDHPL